MSDRRRPQSRSSSGGSGVSPIRAPPGADGWTPLPAYLNFVPGGILCSRPDDGVDVDVDDDDDWIDLASCRPESVVRDALRSDRTLRRYAVLCARREKEEGGGGGGGTAEAGGLAFPHAAGAGAPGVADGGGGGGSLEMSSGSLDMEDASSAADADGGGDEEEGGATKKVPHFLPSLSVLADAAFGSLTGVPPSAARRWADALVLSYLDADEEEDDDDKFWTEEEILAAEYNDDAAAPPLPAVPSPRPFGGTTLSSSRPTSPSSSSSSFAGGADLPSTLRRLLEESTASYAASLHLRADGVDGRGGDLPRPPKTRPCGYVFRRGDIAWNCRTCQTDATCVLCDACFRDSDHDGHEVFFHRTTPGGCCDCGDAEAWRVEGCCPRHRPNVPVARTAGEGGSAALAAAGGALSLSSSEAMVEGSASDADAEGGTGGGSGPDDTEAVKSSLRGRQDGEEALTCPSTSLPPRFAAALGIAIGSAVRCVVRAADGAGAASDLVQWRVRWLDEACRVADGAPHDEDYYLLSSSAAASAASSLSAFRSSSFSPRGGFGLEATATAHARRAASAPEGGRRRRRFLAPGDFLRRSRPAPSAPPSTTAASSPSSLSRQGLAHRPSAIPPEPSAMPSSLSAVAPSSSSMIAAPAPSPPQPPPNPLPAGFRLHLRLHNDDVHTFEEVIDALHKPNRGRAAGRGQPSRGGSSSSSAGGDSSFPSLGGSPSNASETDTSWGLVREKDDASDMTHHVDSDGQVTVRTYATIEGAKAGYRRLKGRGLHCAVVSGPQVEAEGRARELVRWLSEVRAAHPAAGALVVQALVDATEGKSSDERKGGGGIGGVCVWGAGGGCRSIPPWAGGAISANGATAAKAKAASSPSAFVAGPAAAASGRARSSNIDRRRELYAARFDAFPPHRSSSYLTREEGQKLHGLGLGLDAERFARIAGCDPLFYASVPYRLPSERYAKSPHALWGTLPSRRPDGRCPASSLARRHPLLSRLLSPVAYASGTDGKGRNDLSAPIYVVDTDLRKQQEADRLTVSVCPHRLSGLHMISGVGTVRLPLPPSPSNSAGGGGGGTDENDAPPPPAAAPPEPDPANFGHLLSASSYRAPSSPLLLLLLLDPYPPKQLRAALHSLFLCLLVDSRFKCRFAAAIGAVAYRPLTTLFCAGVGTESDTPLGFTVQIFTAGSLVRALGNAAATRRLLCSDDGGDDGSAAAEADPDDDESAGAAMAAYALPVAHTVARCIHTNLLGATKEVHMVLGNTVAGNVDDSDDDDGGGGLGPGGNDAMLPALTYQPGEHPLATALPAAPDDGFLDSRSTRHKRLPHLLRDLEYVFETPGTALRLLLPPPPSLSTTERAASPTPHPSAGRDGGVGGDPRLLFPAAWARLLRLAQGMDPQKRKTGGGHVEYEQNRWLEAFGLSLNFAGTRDALAESSTVAPPPPVGGGGGPSSSEGLRAIRAAVGNLLAALLREMKLWLYREGLLETGLPLPGGAGGPSHGAGGMGELAQVEALQRSTLHVSGGPTSSAAAAAAAASASQDVGDGGGVRFVALSCATGVKMTEAQLSLIEGALRLEQSQRSLDPSSPSSVASTPASPGRAASGPPGTAMGDWLRVPHSPYGGDSLSFHLPLHRALARSVRSVCSVVVPDADRIADPGGWWLLPVLDDDLAPTADGTTRQHPLAALLRPTLRPANCRVVWSAGPDCTPPEARARRSRSRSVSAAIASAKVAYSLADHPLRCLAAAQQIERHLWARNGSAAAGMALNYNSAPLCRSFRDLDLTMVQLSAAGCGVGLGARRVFALMTSRFNMDGYLCDLERRSGSSPTGSPTGSPTSYGAGAGGWVNPPRLQDPEHAVALSESFFATLCLLTTELPPPPPSSHGDDSALRRGVRRELLHALAAAPKSHSEAMASAAGAVTRRDEGEGSSVESNGGAGSAFREVFADVLRDVGQAKNLGSSRAANAGPPTFELRADVSDEYDPAFFHLRRHEHQHAMDGVARLRRQKVSGNGSMSPRGRFSGGKAKCLPLVCPPPIAHPRFLPCRLLLHLPPMDAAIRRALLFALTGGMWLPPDEPEPEPEEGEGDESGAGSASSPDAVDSGGEGGPSPRSAAAAADAWAAATTTIPRSAGSPPTLQPAFGRRAINQQSSFNRNSRRHTSPRGSRRSDGAPPFSPASVAASSVSFLEVLQILTLQVHTLEECASLHRTLGSGLDGEGRAISAGLSINSYLGRLVHVPESLVGAWALLSPAEGGPLPSRGSGTNRGSVLGLLIALYEHRADHGGDGSDGAGSGGADMGGSGHGGDEGHGGARALAADGLKWLLRFVNALVDGAVSVGAACLSATNGVPIRAGGSGSQLMSSSARADAESGTSWTIDPSVRAAVAGMLSDLPDLWPKDESDEIPSSSTGSGGGMSAKSREARKAAQLRALERMRKQQASFAASLTALDASSGSGKKSGAGDVDDEADLCIICRCDDADGENNGPLGYLGHVQRSRALQLRASVEAGNRANYDNDGADDTERESSENLLYRTYRVVGDRGCQLRATESMDSTPVACLPMGSIVTILRSKVSQKYDLQSRRVLVRHVPPNTAAQPGENVTEGWASIQSSQGYVILSPLSHTCYTNGRWGSTRPIIRQCGHAAHLRCVEIHCVSLHQRAAGDQPYDGRFAANIDDGEFLCPLCKQLSNILVPRDGYGMNDSPGITPHPSRMNSQISTVSSSANDSMCPNTEGTEVQMSATAVHMVQGVTSLRSALVSRKRVTYSESEHKDLKAMHRFGDHLLQAMEIPWEKMTPAKKKKQQNWHPAIRRWDYEEEEGDLTLLSSFFEEPCVGKVLRLLRQQHIAWAATGHNAASAEASSRGICQTVDSGMGGGRGGGGGARLMPGSSSSVSAPLKQNVTSDPWLDYDENNRDSHPMLLELRRTMTATSGLLEVLSYEMGKNLGTEEEKSREESVTLVGSLLADILEGEFWSLGIQTNGGGGGSSVTPTPNIVSQWSILTAFLTSMPCHVARDGMLSPRHEARATAAAMWAVKGLGTAPGKSSVGSDVSGDQNHADPSAEGTAISPLQAASTDIHVPPIPLAVDRICSSTQTTQERAGRDGQARFPQLPRPWGTMNPFVMQNMDDKKKVQGQFQPNVPFRPALASAFLYVPLLAWDLNTLAGAILSTMLSNNDHQRPSSDDLLLASHMLLTGRLVQILITPHGYDLSSNVNHQDATTSTDGNHWSADKLVTEGKSLGKLLAHCQSIIKDEQTAPHRHLTKSTSDVKQFHGTEGKQLLQAVGRAILPFARSLVLLLRACASATRQRQRQHRRESGQKHEEPASSEVAFESVLENPEVLCNEDGWFVLSMIGGPLPSQILSESLPRSDGKTSISWIELINRWLSAVVTLEAHHGSRGMRMSLNTSISADDAPEKSQHTLMSGALPVASTETNLQTSTSLHEGAVGIEVEVSSDAAQSTNRAGVLRNTFNATSDGVNSSGLSSGEDSGEEEDEGYGFGNFAEDEEMADEENIQNIGENVAGFVANAMNAQLLHEQHVGLMENDDVASDEEGLMEMDIEAGVDEAAGDFDEALGDAAVLGFEESLPQSDSSTEDRDELDDEKSNYSNSSPLAPSDQGFACVSRSPIIPYQPSLLGIQGIGPGPTGSSLDYLSASSVMCDLSHLGLVHRSVSPISALVRLPQSFVELYSLVNRVKGRDNHGSIDEADDGSSTETAICLLTGAIMRSGSSRRVPFSRSSRPPGSCTLHARKVGSGIGIFFLVQKCTVLLMHNNKSAYSASLYVDEHGEEDPGLRRGRPLMLKEARYEALEILWRKQGIPREVAQIRSTSDRVIRDNWY